MKELAKKTLFYGAGVLFKSPSMFSKIRISSNVHLTVPYYHAISNEDIPHLKHIISYKNLTEFRDDISFFSSNYSFIGIPELIDYFSGNHTLPPSPMLITFDDGLKEFYENAAPILEEFKASAAVFINSDFLDNKNMFYRHKESLLVETLLKNKDAEINDRISSILGLAPHLPEFKIKKSLLNIGYSNKALLDKVAEELGLDFNEYLSFVHPYMTSENINDLINRGFFIGAHSLDHPEYKFLDYDQQLFQTTKSMQVIVDRFKLPYRIFSAPFHDSDLSVEYFKTILDRYVDISFGIDGTYQDSFSKNIQRFNMEGEQHYPAYKMLAAYFIVIILRKLIQKQKIQRPNS